MKSGGYKLIVPKENALVTKHNKLIEARYSLSLQEQRLMLWIVSQIEPEDKELEGFSIRIRDLAQFLGIERNKNIYKQMEQITRGLVTKGIELRNLEKDTLLQTTWLGHAYYRFGEGIVELSVSDKLTPYLIELRKHFTTIPLRVAVSLKSSYTIRIYELLKQYQKTGQRTIQLDDFRLYLGIKPKQYPKYNDFKKRTVIPAHQEINSKTDIRFEFEEIKRGRKITAIKFSISANDAFTEVVKLPMGNTKGVDLVSRLKSHGVKDQRAWQIVHAYIESDPERVAWHIDELERRIGSGTKTTSPAGWLVKAIDTDHRPQKTLFQKNTEQAEIEAKEKRKAREVLARRIEHLESQITAQGKQYRLYMGKEIDKWRETLTDAEMEAIGLKIESGLEKAYAKSNFKRHKWGSMLNQDPVIAYLKSSGTPLPYASEDEFFASENLPVLSDLEAELKKLQS